MIKKIVKPVLIFLLGALACALLDHFLWPGILDALDEKIFGKREMIINVNEVRLLEDAQHLEDFSFMFETANGQGTIIAVQKGHTELNKKFGDALIPHDLGRDGNDLEYFIGVKNNSNRKAKDIRMSFSGDTLKADYGVDVDKGFDFVNCGGSGSQYTCDIRKKKLAPNDKVGIFVKARTPSIANVNFQTRDNDDYFVNFRRFYVRIIGQGESVQISLGNDEVAKLPPLNGASNLLQYYYSPQENKWITM